MRVQPVLLRGFRETGSPRRSVLAIPMLEPDCASQTRRRFPQRVLSLICLPRFQEPSARRTITHSVAPAEKTDAEVRLDRGRTARVGGLARQKIREDWFPFSDRLAPVKSALAKLDPSSVPKPRKELPPLPTGPMAGSRRKGRR